MAHLKNRRPRRGIVLIALMIFLAVAMAMVLAWLKLAGLERRQLRSLQAQAQATWLAESALQRAAARLAADPQYSGETWKLTPADLGGRDAGEVVIRVDAIADQPAERSIIVQADYPIDLNRRNRRTKTVRVTVPAQGGSS